MVGRNILCEDVHAHGGGVQDALDVIGNGYSYLSFFSKIQHHS